MRYVLAVCALLLSACAYEVPKGLEITDGEITTPKDITNAWAAQVREAVQQGKIRRIQCDTLGGEIRGVLKLVETLQDSPHHVEVTVPRDKWCRSAGATLWFGAPYRNAIGGVVLHTVNTHGGTRYHKELSKKAADVLAKAGADESLQYKVIKDGWYNTYAMTRAEITKYSKSP